MKNLLSTTVITATFLMSAACGTAFAQDTAPNSNAQTIEEDVVIAIGRKSQSGLKAMQAFNAGDFETAEIEFERHFDALQRTQRATKRAARVGSNASLTSQIISGPGEVSAGGAGASQDAGAVFSVNTPTAASNAAVQNNTLRNASRSDQNADYEDFAFARYMTALSQIQLGKFTEAKLSLRESVDHNYRNYDAQMRLGLLELRDGEVLEARDRLIRIDKMRKTCGGCEDKAAISEAAVTLARALTDATG